MAVEPIAVGHAERQVALARRTSLELLRLWRLVDPRFIRESWRSMLPQALVVLSTSQGTAAAGAGLYVEDALEAQGITAAAAGRVNPASFAGIASDGRPLALLLNEPSIATVQQIGRGATTPRALATGAFRLDMITRTQVADAGRVAVGTAIAVRPHVGYVRMLNGKSCARCVVLAGRVYRWNAGFQRHPRCDCRPVPIAEDAPGDVRTDPRAYFDSLSRAEQGEVFTKEGAAAIREGADIARVVNARRNMQTADVYGRRVQVTTEAANRGVRLMPEQIFRDARDRDDAIRLLRLHGYIL